MGNISSKLIATKEMLEKNGIMDTKQFSGFGKKETKPTDPAARLRQLVKTKYKGQLKHDKKQSGGVLPLAPIAIAALGAVAGEIVKDIYGLIKRKLSGSGMKFNHKNNDMKLFLIQLLQSIK